MSVFRFINVFWKKKKNLLKQKKKTVDKLRTISELMKAVLKMKKRQKKERQLVIGDIIFQCIKNALKSPNIFGFLCGSNAIMSDCTPVFFSCFLPPFLYPSCFFFYLPFKISSLFLNPAANSTVSVMRKSRLYKNFSQ